VLRCFGCVPEKRQIKNILVGLCDHSYDVTKVVLLRWNRAVHVTTMVKCYVGHGKVNRHQRNYSQIAALNQVYYRQWPFEASIAVKLDLEAFFFSLFFTLLILNNKGFVWGGRCCKGRPISGPTRGPTLTRR